MVEVQGDIPVSIKAAYGAGIFFALCTILTNMWCFVVILSAKKLRKPLWLFRASLSLKDVVVSLLILLPIVFNGMDRSRHSSSKNQSFEIGYCMAIALITCVAASIFTLLCMSIDRYQATTRPFRYHTGELMPTRVAVVAIFYCWMFGLVAGISVATDYTGGGQRLYGILIDYVSVEKRQKALLLGGLTLVYAISATLFTVTLIKVYRQKQKIRLRMINGEPEQIRSERNSFSEEPVISPRRFSPKRHRSDSESDANEFFLNTEDDYLMRKKKKWSLTVTQKITFFTPTSYRPSILRRIRDTWYLYIAIWTCFITLFGTIIPIYFAMIGGGHCDENQLNSSHREGIAGVEGFTADSVPESNLTSFCAASVFCDCLLLFQGFICVVLYSFTDDVFRPEFLRPIRCLISKMKCVQKEPRIRTSYRLQRKDRRSSSREVSAVRP